MEDVAGGGGDICWAFLSVMMRPMACTNAVLMKVVLQMLLSGSSATTSSSQDYFCC